MVSVRSCLAAFLVLSVIGALPEAALAKPTVKGVRDEARDINKQILELIKDFKKLSPANRKKAIAALSKLSDADGDNVPDLLELTGKSRCDSDSDNDGLDDGDEYRNGTKPNDRDSDDDGVDDGDDDDGDGDGSSDSAEIEVKGRLVAKSSSQITVGTTVFALTGSTTFRQGSVRTGLTIDDFAVDSCVEVEGVRSGTENTATKVKSDDDCL